MAAADPTYPAYPIASLLATVMMLLVLSTNLVRQHWNLGVTFLCVWLCLDNLIFVVNTIAWSDNADIKLYAWCDLTSRISVAIVVGENIAPLLITRRLYQIAKLQSVSPPSKKARRRDRVIDYTLGILWPLVSAGPLYYIIEAGRFQVIEGLGCTNELDTSISTFVLAEIWSVLPPLISILFYCPKVALAFYRHSKDVNTFLRHNNSVSHPNYLRTLAIASIDILLTLPIGLVSLGFELQSSGALRMGLPFYSGWNVVHSHWTPKAFTYAERVTSRGTYDEIGFYWSLWSTPAEAFAIFGLFGLTAEARTSYWRIICAIGRWFGWKPSLRASDTELGANEGVIEFGERPVGGISLGSGMRTPSFVNVEPPRAEDNVQREVDGEPRESITDADEIEETSRSPRDVGEAHDRQIRNTETASTDVATQPVEIAGSAV
ncbi:STE3-domain-containing protein [Peniophora sp. CONT]|nr:STE3-domain-containing protein [Peniophora sp. CONT]